MSKELVISATPHETRVAIMEDGQLCEIYIEREKEFALVGSLYKGRVTRVLPGMQSAFVDIGLDSDAFLYVSDFLEHLEEYDHVAPAEPKAPKPEAKVAQVYPPTTTNGGVEAAPVQSFVPEPEAAAPKPVEIPEAVESIPIITPLAGESFQVVAAAQNTSAEGGARPTAPMQRVQHPPFEQRNDRGRGGFGGGRDRGGRGGRNNKFGGRGGQNRGGRDRRPGSGRDLPPSKYASPSDSKPRESRPYEPPAATDFEPIILPGESLSIFKDRVPSAHGIPPAAPASHSLSTAESVPALPSTRIFTDEELSAGLPGSLFATPAAVSPVEHVTPVSDVKVETSTGVSKFAAPAAPEAEMESQIILPDAEAEHDELPEILAVNGASLSDEEVTSLAEQLAEAKHEEAQAESRPEAIEAVAETFVEPAEIEELQDALETDADEDLEAEHESEQDADHESDHESDHDADHEEAENEADALADEMHEVAMAADAAPEHGEGHEAEHGELQAEGHDEGHEDGHEAEHDEEHESAHGEIHLGDHAEGREELQAGMAGQQSGAAQPPTSARVSEQPRARFQRPMRRGNRPQRGGGGGRRPGGRPHQPPRHGHPRHEQHRRPQLISEMLKAGEEIIVQIAKEPLGKKGARITSHVALPGRFLVYMPTVDHIGVSRRIGSAEDRSRLRRLVTEAKGTFPGGFIVRTAASEASDDEIRTDVEFLGRTWDTIRGTSEQRRAPSLLHRDLNLVQRILRDYLSEDYAAIWLNNEEEFAKVVEFVSRFQPKLVSRVKLYTKETPIFEEFGIQQELDKALRPKVWLKSGGYIVINHTEALVAIDVNTGKYVGRGSTRLEDTIVKTNLEAVKEIVRQIRLRDLGGIIVCDFIDMEERRNREKVMAALEQTLQQDRAPSKALSFNEFGLVCITRKRTKQALERVLCQPCPYCTGSGMVKSIPTICYEIQTEAKKMAADLDAQNLTLRVNPEIAKALKTRESSLIEDLEHATRKAIVIQSDPTLHWEQYDIY
ncbi:MAG TPA: Rne/Rng family ribonuclease [Candidatus Acidoferrales bacterium]|jgi:ribonuclease G|nr:Rne/Rng family ribonuclease [Candidatus Acidoferrales bacterium]